MGTLTINPQNELPIVPLDPVELLKRVIASAEAGLAQLDVLGEAAPTETRMNVFHNVVGQNLSLSMAAVKQVQDVSGFCKATSDVKCPHCHEKLGEVVCGREPHGHDDHFAPFSPTFKWNSFLRLVEEEKAP